MPGKKSRSLCHWRSVLMDGLTLIRFFPGCQGFTGSLYKPNVMLLGGKGKTLLCK